MMSTRKCEAADAMRNGSWSSNEPEKHTIPGITTERLFPLIDRDSSERAPYARKTDSPPTSE
jgi:hypothetical protein